MKFSKYRMPAAVIAAAILVTTSRLFLSRTNEPAPAAKRPSNWALPIETKGLPNFYKVTDDLYRGAQPTAKGIEQLKNMGIKTIINLRSAHSDKDEIGRIDIGYENINFKPWNVEQEDIKRFLAIVTDKTKTPVFVHCKYGADRTGFMCAVYRMAVCGWEKQAAIDEMVNGGFGFHPMWKNIIKSLEKIDTAQIRESIPNTTQSGKPN